MLRTCPAARKCCCNGLEFVSCDHRGKAMLNMETMCRTMVHFLLIEKDIGAASSGEYLLRSSLRSFHMLGAGPVGSIDVPTYKRRMSLRKTKALTDDAFVGECVYALTYSPEVAPNGMQLVSKKGKETLYLTERICEVSGTGSNVLLLVLDPSGRGISFNV